MSLPNVAITYATATTTDLASYASEIQIERGRRSPVFDDIDAGTCDIVLNNFDRTFDPLYASSSLNGYVIPGRQVNVDIYGNGWTTIFQGRVEDWDLAYEQSTRSTAVAHCADVLAELGRAEFDEHTTNYGEQPLTRIFTELSRPEVPGTYSVGGTEGPTYLAADLVTWGSNVLNYLQLIAKTDMGLLFANRINQVTYRSRLYFPGRASEATFGGAGIGFENIGVSYGRELLYNRVIVQRYGGVPQTVSDATSIATYGVVRTLNMGSDLLMQDDTTALDLATQLLKVYKDPLWRVETLSLKLGNLTGTQIDTVCGLDIGSVVTVTFTPNNVGSAITRTCVVEGIRHRIDPEKHVVELTLNDSSVFQLGNFYKVQDATYGAVNGGGVLAYPIVF